MSRTTPLAVRRSGGIKAEEPTGVGSSVLFGSEVIWRGPGVVRIWGCLVDCEVEVEVEVEGEGER